MADIMEVCSYADLPRSMPKTSKKRLFEHAFFIHQGLSSDIGVTREKAAELLSAADGD
eukprot:gene27481-26165_t